MFQATYVYFMLIATQYYWTSQVRVKQALWERKRMANEAAWALANRRELEEYWEEEEESEADDFDENEREELGTRREYRGANYD